jgi:hypothetical protein
MMENSKEAPQKLKIELPQYTAMALLGYTGKNLSQIAVKTPSHSCVLQHYAQELSYGDSDYGRWSEKVWSLYTMEL